MRVTAGALAAAVVLAACTSTPRARVEPAPSTTSPVFTGGKPVRFALESRPLGFDADGNAQWLVIAHFFDARGRVTRILANSDLDWISRDGYVQWQNRMRFGQPSAIVKTHRDGKMTLLVRCNKPALGSHAISTDTRSWKFPRVAAAVLGAYAVQIGWFPQESQAVRVTRTGCGRTPGTRSWTRASGTSSVLDTAVGPGETCRYAVARAGEFGSVTVTLPPAPPSVPLTNFSGTGMWLYFTTNPLDPIYYANLNAQQIVDRAVRAHLQYVELRTAYGAFWQITPQARPAIDAIIDGLAAHGIVTIGWTVPRDDAIDDVEASVRTAYYRTARGTPLGGLAIDLERGDEFMGGAPDGLDALWKYVAAVRLALGTRYPIAATIEDPYLEHLSESSYPYAQIARVSSILQPMTYARMLRRRPLNASQTAGIVRASWAAVSALARANVPISMGAQTNAIGPGGAPEPAEVLAAMAAARDSGAIGTCFFAWDGTSPAQWDAISDRGT
ncbi:MAG TPA: hypothetical protein VGZ02_03930 [Candidatus Baltobacteraceae bacterium]|nr:hypothetical protein [Candidatus Baltobacteraceae bacterium]